MSGTSASLLPLTAMISASGAVSHRSLRARLGYGVTTERDAPERARIIVGREQADRRRIGPGLKAPLIGRRAGLHQPLVTGQAEL